MKKSQSGFTLIELVVVIVLLGILGVTALGKYQDLSGSARKAALTGIATEISGASKINFAKGYASGSYTVALKASNVCTVDILKTLLQTGAFPSASKAYAVTNESGKGDCSGGAGTTTSCIIYQDTDSATGYSTTDDQAVATLICGG